MKGIGKEKFVLLEEDTKFVFVQERKKEGWA